jgi:Cu/Ag efflux protein CusF
LGSRAWRPPGRTGVEAPLGRRRVEGRERGDLAAVEVEADLLADCGGGSGDSKPASSNAPPSKAATPVNRLQFVGVVKAIDVPTGRITIAYEPVEAINWPAGTQPFPVAKTAMLTAATVGQKVRFNLDSGQISALAPFDPPPS